MDDSRAFPHRMVGNKRHFVLLLTVLSLFLGGGCSDEAETSFVDEGRGSLLSLTLLQDVSKELLNSFEAGLEAEFDVSLYKMTYRTITSDGAETIASGVIAHPQGFGGKLPLASYQHGTVVKKDLVASVLGLNDIDGAVVAYLAAVGYLAVASDYLGLGDSPGLHPYVHGASLGSSIIDAMRAGRIFAERENLDLDGGVFLLGYSEGGYATFAAQKMIEEGFSSEFDIQASAPMAGPYSLSEIMAEMLLSGEAYGASFYLPYAILAYEDIYDLYDDPSEVFASPYDQTIPPLFDGTQTGEDINEELPVIPLEMLNPTFVTEFQTDPEHGWRSRLEENDLIDWSPTSRTRLYHCENDDLVPYANAEMAIASFRERGVSEATVDLVSEDYGGHGDCALPFMLQAKVWFDEIQLSSK